jgi:hypothetical protein
MKYWINTISRDHVELGVKGGFTQAGHGKATSLKRLHNGEWIIFYSPRTTYTDGQTLRNFTAIGTIQDDAPYQVAMTANFHPWRRKVEFYDCVPIPVEPFIPELSFIKDKTHWGYMFRLGLFEIPEQDFAIIRDAMIVATS